MAAPSLESGNGQATWQLAGERATLNCGELSASLEVSKPQLGLTNLRFSGIPVSGSFLGIATGKFSGEHISTTPSDVYVRDHDLVVAYQASEEQAYGLQVYWSAAREGEGVILDVTISVQTRRWEAYPEVMVSSSITNVIASGGEDPFLRFIRPEFASWTYAEMAPNLDFAAGFCLSAPTSLIEWIFKDKFMERGVIRRLRVRGAIVPRENDEAVAARIREAFLAEQPPLTA